MRGPPCSIKRVFATHWMIMMPCPICEKMWVEYTSQSMVAVDLDSSAATVHLSLPFSAYLLFQAEAVTFLIRDCKTFKIYCGQILSG